MTQVVADEALGRFARQQHDWFERVRKGSLDPDEVARAVQQIIDRSSVFQHDMRKKEWKPWALVEDVDDAGEISITNLELVSFLKKGEDLISGEEMRKRAKELNANLGQRHAEYLLEHQKEIPVEWREFDLVFTGTLWREQKGGSFFRRRDSFYMPCLSWGGGGWWSLYFGWLGRNWDSGERLLRPRK